MSLEVNNPILALKAAGVKRGDVAESRWSGGSAEVVIAYGVGDGSLQVACDRLIWIAKDVADACNALDRVTCTMDEIDILKTALWKCVGKKRSWMVLEGLDCTAVKAQVEELITGIELTLAKAAYFGVQELENVLLNHGQGFDASALYGKYKGVPAVICGAGPSLSTSMDWLKEVDGRALIFAGGSALGALIDAGVRPSFGLGCDPDPEHEQIQKGLGLGTPFFYTADFSAKLLSQVKGDKFWVRHTGALEMERWLWDKGDALDIGWNAGTMATAIACEMGCNPIVFVGMDLAYGSLTKAAGIVDRSSVESMDAIDKHGAPVKTRRDLVMSQKWIQELIQKNRDRTWIDATPQGLAIKGAIAQIPPFDQVFEMELEKIKITKGNTLAIKESIASCADLIKKIEQDPLAQVLIETECFYRHLKALWDIFKNTLEDQSRLQEYVFYKRVMDGFKRLG